MNSQRDRDLCTHDGREAVVEIAEPLRNLIAADRIKIVLHCMSIAIRIQTSFKEQTHRRDNSDNSEYERGRGTPGKMCDVAQVMGLLLERVDRDRSEALEIGKRQFNLAPLRPGAGGRD